MNKALYYIQLALRTGKASFGSRLIPSIQKGSTRLVIASELLGSNQRKKLTDKCRSYDIPLIFLDAAAFEKISSKAALAYGIEDKGLAQRVRDCLDQKE